MRLQGFWSEFQWPTLVTSQIWIDTIVDYVSTEIEVWGRKQARKNGDIEALADAMRALKNLWYLDDEKWWHKTFAKVSNIASKAEMLNVNY